MDNGSAFISKRLRAMCEGQIDLLYIPPGKPWNNGFVELFNQRRRKECEASGVLFRGYLIPAGAGMLSW